MSSMHRTEDILDKITKSLETWKKLILDVYESNENQINVLKNHVESYSQLEQACEKTNTALQQMDEKLNSAMNKCEDIDSLFQECFDCIETGSSVNHQDGRMWQAVFKGISDVTEVRKKKKKLDDNQYEEIGDSLLCSNVFVPPIDPISKVVVRNPYKNRNCGHTYEYDTIKDYIRRMKNKAKCPYIGCNNHQLKMTDLVEDSQLQMEITQYLETQPDEEEEEEDD